MTPAFRVALRGGPAAYARKLIVRYIRLTRLTCVSQEEWLFRWVPRIVGMCSRRPHRALTPTVLRELENVVTETKGIVLGAKKVLSKDQKRGIEETQGALRAVENKKNIPHLGRCSDARLNSNAVPADFKRVTIDSLEYVPDEVMVVDTHFPYLQIRVGKKKQSGGRRTYSVLLKAAVLGTTRRKAGGSVGNKYTEIALGKLGDIDMSDALDFALVGGTIDTLKGPAFVYPASKEQMLPRVNFARNVRSMLPPPTK